MDDPEIMKELSNDFMAPEILNKTFSANKGDQYCSAVDMWSFGVLWYYMIFGRTPFVPYGEQTLIQAIKKQEGFYLPTISSRY